MNESRVNGTQADEAQADGTLADGNGNDGRDVEKLRRQRLNEFLRELVRQEGRMEAAELLGVNYRTLVKAEESGEITGRMSDALERLLLSGDGPGEPKRQGPDGELGRQVERLESDVKRLAKELRDGLEEIRAAVSGKAGAQTETEGHAQTQEDNGDGGAAGRSETRAAPPVAGLGSKRPFRERRLDPEIVTVEPAEDDAEVYGAAWPLVEEWRGLRAGHPHQGGSLSWLVTEERLLVLELAMLDDHGLTLPPEKQPLRGFGRKGQTQLAKDGAGGHQDGAAQAAAAALGAAVSHPGAVAEVGGERVPGAGPRGLLHRCYVGASDSRRDARLARPKPSIRSDVRAIIGAVSGFSSVPALETWRILVS